MLKIAIAFFMVFFVWMNAAFAVTPVAAHGQLAVKGSDIVNQYGEAVALKGMSTHGLQWFGNIITKERMTDLRDNWKTTIIRSAMYTKEGGYIDNPSVKNKMIEIINWSIELGMYVIVDWHILRDNNPQTYQAQSIDFFSDISSRYAGYPNVIYEICNEPNGNISWSGNIKPYAMEVAKAIRQNDPNNIILVGSGNWSQNIQDPAADPLPYSNTAYTLHFYAGTHGQWLRDRIDQARSKGIAIYVSEWGVTDSSGGGAIYLDASKTWLDFLAKRNIGWTNWTYSNAGESSAALTGNFQLTQSGQFVKNNMNWNIFP